jgi:hypothetical protein
MKVKAKEIREKLGKLIRRLLTRLNFRPSPCIIPPQTSGYAKNPENALFSSWLPSAIRAGREGLGPDD